MNKLQHKTTSCDYSWPPGQKSPVPPGSPAQSFSQSSVTEHSRSIYIIVVNVQDIRNDPLYLRSNYDDLRQPYYLCTHCEKDFLQPVDSSNQTLHLFSRPKTLKIKTKHKCTQENHNKAIRLKLYKVLGNRKLYILVIKSKIGIIYGLYWILKME